MKILAKTIESKGGNKYRIYANTVYAHSDIKVTVKIRRWFLWFIPYWISIKERVRFDDWTADTMEFKDYVSALKYINQIEALNN